MKYHKAYWNKNDDDDNKITINKQQCEKLEQNNYKQQL